MGSSRQPRGRASISRVGRGKYLAPGQQRELSGRLEGLLWLSPLRELREGGGGGGGAVIVLGNGQHKERPWAGAVP